MLVLTTRENDVTTITNKEGDEIKILCKKGNGTKQLQLYIHADKKFIIKRVDGPKKLVKNDGTVKTNNERPVNECTRKTDKLYQNIITKYHKDKKST